MPEFDALGRDVAAAADSTFDAAVAGAVKALWASAGFDQGDNPNHLWTVAVDVQSDRFSVSAVVKDGNVYTPPPYPDTPATVDEISRNADAASAEGDGAAVAAEPAPAAPIEVTAAPNADASVAAVEAPIDVQATPAPEPEPAPEAAPEPAPAPAEPDASAA